MRDPRSRQGTEPVNARSPLKLRALLSAIFAPLFALGAAGFAVASTRSAGDRATLYAALAALCATLTMVAVADLVAVIRRRRRPSP